MNLSMCLLKSGEWIDARDLCEKVISENSGVAKAFFRRGEAQIHLNDLEGAESDFKVILNSKICVWVVVGDIEKT